MLRFLKSLFAWETAFRAGCHVYEENRVTGQRRALRWCSGGYSPVDLDWLDAGFGHPTIDGRPAWRTAQGQMDGRYCY